MGVAAGAGGDGDAAVGAFLPTASIARIVGAYEAGTLRADGIVACDGDDGGDSAAGATGARGRKIAEARHAAKLEAMQRRVAAHQAEVDAVSGERDALHAEHAALERALSEAEAGNERIRAEIAAMDALVTDDTREQLVRHM